MIVELFGLPGVGKSFLSRRLERRFRQEELDELHTTATDDRQAHALSSLAFKLSRAVRFAALHLGTSVALFSTVRSAGRGLRYRSVKKLINLLAELDRTARTPESRTLVNEQGVLQAIWSLNMLSGESVHADLLDLVARWLPDAVVFVDVERRVHMQRLRQRADGRSRFDRLDDDELPEAVERGLRELREILDGWSARTPGGDRLDFWNTDGVDGEDVVAWLERLHSARALTSPPAGVRRTR